MRRNAKQKILALVLLTCAALPSASMAGAIPPDPDNAALLYYQALLTMPEPKGEVADNLVSVARGEVEPDQIRTFLLNCRNTLEFVEAAAEVGKCDWGYRFSLGLDVQLPQLSQLRRLSYILAADARLAAFDGEHRQALERCRLLDALSRHVGDDTLICYLVSLAVRQLAMSCVQDITGQIADEAEGLRELRAVLAMAAPLTVSPIRPLKFEVEIMGGLMTMDNRDRLVEMMSAVPDKDMPQGAEEVIEEANKETERFIAALDAKTLEKAQTIYRERIAAILTVMNTPLPYAEKHSRLKKLCDDFDQTDPAARVAGAFMANMAKIYTLRIRSDAHANAILAAVDIYLQRAETGKLPAALPTGLPKDPFSGKDFQYEQTETGFTLRCQAKDPTKDITHEYTFKLQ